MNTPIFYVTSELYQAGRRDDGTPFIAEVYFVQAEYPNGERLDHHARFRGCDVTVDDEDGYSHFADIRPQAEARAGRLLNRILEGGGAINRAHWSEGRPVYGSEAYDPRAEIDLERREFEDEAFA